MGRLRRRTNFHGSPYGKYGDFIEELDWSVGRILETLDSSKLADKTLVIFTSDNGGVLDPMGEGEEALALHAGLAINGILRGGKHGIYEGGFREPFIVRWPGKVPAGTVCDHILCHSRHTGHVGRRAERAAAAGQCRGQPRRGQFVVRRRGRPGRPARAWSCRPRRRRNMPCGRDRGN